MGFTYGVTEVYGNLQPEKWPLRGASAEVCKAVSGMERVSGERLLLYLLMQEVRVSKEAVRGRVLKKQERFHLCTTCS